MEAAADEWFAAMQASIRFGTAVAAIGAIAISAIKGRPVFLPHQRLVFSLSWLVLRPQNYGKSSAKDLRFSHDRAPAVILGAQSRGFAQLAH
jgi:hypothetical protein